MLYLGCLATSSGSLGLLNSTKRVIHFCNKVEGGRLPKCENRGGSSITLASPLVFYVGSWLLLSYVISLYPLYMFLSFRTPKKYTSIGIRALATLLAKLPSTKHIPTKRKTHKKKLHKTSTVPNQKSGTATPCHHPAPHFHHFSSTNSQYVSSLSPNTSLASSTPSTREPLSLHPS